MNTLRLVAPRISQSVLRLGAARFASAQSNDPIQRAFLEKLRDYAQKSKTAEMGLVDAKPEDVKSLQEQLAKLDAAFEAKGQDMTKFPTFSFTEPDIKQVGSSIVCELPQEAVKGSETENEEATYVPGSLII
ncbi:Atp5jp [Cichlidogyrus casuarinus]|uniref:Atp5jp n=1 Tax=Cichlidogyrus casuarinus TaxID=1844966 RepID=A0ABD2Q538_9PLAT